MTILDITLSNARRFYSSIGNPLAVKGLRINLGAKGRVNKFEADFIQFFAMIRG